MSKVVAISGVDDVPAAPVSPRMMMLWGVVLGTAVGIFFGTTMLNPSRKKRS